MDVRARVCVVVVVSLVVGGSSPPVLSFVSSCPLLVVSCSLVVLVGTLSV